VAKKDLCVCGKDGHVTEIKWTPSEILQDSPPDVKEDVQEFWRVVEEDGYFQHEDLIYEYIKTNVKN
jgi:hypothetical protein